MKICAWNIERNIVKFEEDIINVIVRQKVDILFLSEVDSYVVDESYKILNFTTFVHKKSSDSKKTRLIALVSEKICNNTIERVDLQICDYPVITLEISMENKKK